MNGYHYDLENEKIQSDIDKTIIKEGAKNEREKMKYQATLMILSRNSLPSLLSLMVWLTWA